jgi:hypothetical protein
VPWEKVKPRRQSAETATLRGDGIGLSGEFVKNNNLMGYKWVELFFDDTLRRIGFKFQDRPTAYTRKLAKESKGGRIINTRDLRQRAWTKALLDYPVTDRRFLIETDESVKNPTEGVRYYVSVGYRFQPKREFAKQGDYPRLPGVYRLFKDLEIVRIGESDDMESRLKEHHFSYKDEVDDYDFAEIPDRAVRKNEEKRLIEEFRDAHGRLPKLNVITA